MIGAAIVLAWYFGPPALNETLRRMQYWHILAVEIEGRAPSQNPFMLTDILGPIAIVGCISLGLGLLGFLLLFAGEDWRDWLRPTTNSERVSH